MKGRIARVAAALLISLGFIVGPATPAQAWSYCNNPSLGQGVFFWPSQGYCQPGQRIGWASLDVNAPCYTLANHAYDDYAAAVVNNKPFTLTIFQSDNCSFAYEWHDICAYCSDADLYPDQMYRNMSSFKWNT
jgi:hypothetical protein